MYIKKFPSIKDPSEESCAVLWDTIPQQLYHTLYMFHQGRIPNEDFSIADLVLLGSDIDPFKGRPNGASPWAP